MKTHAIALALILSAAPIAAANAQNATVTGAAGGAVTGALVGGPIGAAVGGVAGAVIGTAVAPPKEVREYVIQDTRPAVKTVTYRGSVEVGTVVPEEVELYRVPDSDYSYTVINEKRYIVSPERKIVEVVN